MRRIPRPASDAGTVLDSCVQSLQDNGFAARLNLSRDTIVAGEAAYVEHGNVSALHRIAETDGIGGWVTTREMERLYDGTFVRSARTRPTYEAIKRLPPNGICPLCGQRDIHSLDHHLAKTRHPSLAITPLNLIPACLECNKIKGNRQAAAEADQTLHPYFDDVDGRRWLFAEVAEQVPTSLTYSVVPPADWPPIMQGRIRTHFRTFALSKLYAVHAGVELTNLRPRLLRLSHRGSPDDIAAHLGECAADFASISVNSWQTAMYEACASSAWFCQGGFA